MEALVGNTHLVEGGADSLPVLLAYLAKNGVVKAGDPDLYVRTYRRFGIDEAREVRERSAARALGTRRVFVLAAAALTSEAQNALLKTFEEAPGDALFFLLVPAPQLLLPTLRSRAHDLDLPAHAARSRSPIDARAFIAAAPSARLAMLKPLLEKDEQDSRDIGMVYAFLRDLEQALARAPQGARALYRAKRYLGDKGALLKPLLEQVALLIPKG